MKPSSNSTPPVESATPNTAPSQATSQVRDPVTRVPNMPRDSKGRPYHTQKTLDEDRRLMQQEDLSKVRVW